MTFQINNYLHLRGHKMDDLFHENFIKYDLFYRFCQGEHHGSAIRMYKSQTK
ncbi:MAG: hypothetical protein ACI9GM_000342 [Salibacteraceae bacterium]|jgi:hypothetical protein